MPSGAWSTQQLAEFVAAVSAAETEAAAALAAVERAAEALDVDVAAIVVGGEVVASVGYPGGDAPVDELLAVTPGARAAWLDVPGVGACRAAAAWLDHPRGPALVVARRGPAGLTREETGLLGGMARVASLTMRMLRGLDEERAARAELECLAREQAALRRVATLVAEAGSPEDVFSAVAEEVAQLSEAEIAAVLRYEDDETATVVGSYGDPEGHLPIGARLAVAGQGVAVSVARTRRPARVVGVQGPPGSVADAFRRAGVQTASGSPIIVEGRLWGVVVAARARSEPLAPEAELRIPAFTELVATAIANTEARVDLRAIADEQAALRRIATLVAQATPPAAVFKTVAEEVGSVLPAVDIALVGRYDGEGGLEFVGGWARDREPDFLGRRVPLGGHNVATQVFESNEPARVDRFDDEPARLTSLARRWARSAAGAPIDVEGRLWGVMTVGSAREQGFPAGMEHRLAQFTQLVATAIANAQARAELSASRARIVATADETRRRIGRNLHDGAQQRLVALALQLRGAQRDVPPELGELAVELDRVATGLATTLDELREYARGIHPAILAEGGLEAALKTLAARSAVPVDLDVRVGDRPPERVEVAAYYVVSEALTNAAKHAGASVVAVDVASADGLLRLAVRDDGVGGADLTGGSGLVGLKDRVEALGGRISVASPRQAGTSVEVELPLTDSGDAPG